MKMSKMYIPTLRELPSDAELPSHRLLLRAGMIKRLASGVYTYLPLGYRTIKKIENIVREEMDRIDSQEVLMSAIIPAELWKQTGRWDAFGPEMFKLQDRHEREFCLGPTHEEVFTSTVSSDIKSYKQLPLSLYQIQTKYRDEKRPRFGLMRSREFIMKDAYTFDLDEEGMKNSYKDMWGAYEKIFERCGLRFKVVEGDSGAMGGSDSHEFTAMSEYGESNIVYCNKCDYASTDEKAVCSYSIKDTNKDLKEIEKISTPGIKTIEELTEFFKIDSENFAKMLLYKVKDEIVGVLIPGNRELNETKFINYLNISEHDVEMAEAEDIKRVTGAEVGFSGPIGLKEEIKLLVDSRVTKMSNFIVGANETDMHLKNINYERDFKGEIVEDLLLTKSGDKCPKCGAELFEDRGIEIGNIFQLGTKYSEALGAKYLDNNGKEQLMVMGSHGVGVSRTMAAVIEQNYDENGIIWPMSVSPYEAIVTIVNIKDEEQVKLGEKIYSELKEKGIETILDDRKERVGVKFKDADLIGIPLRITVGKKAMENIVEFSERRNMEKIEIDSETAIKTVYTKVKECNNSY